MNVTVGARALCFGAAIIMQFTWLTTSASSEGAPSVVGTQVRDPQREVTTYAGSGFAGFADGPLRSATFLMPAGLAYERTTQTLYVVDSAAQLIRAVHGTQVKTIAGTAHLLADHLAAAGGYRDGVARSAQFNSPRGIAIGPDGALYVADSGNHCIRRIKDGIVSTFVGNASAPGHVDGDVASSTYQSPRSLAFSADGTLYIADNGNGLRKIKSGVVSTIALPGSKTSTYYNAGIDQLVYAPGSPDAIFVTSETGILRYELSSDKVTGEASYPYSHPAGVAADGAVALTSTSALVVSNRWNSVAFLQFPNGLGTVSPFSRTLTATAENPSETAGYRDGAPKSSRFFGPVSIAAKGDGTFFVSDAGNRVIRTFPAVNGRWPSVQTTPVGANPQKFQIAVIGDSYAFWNCMYDDSIAGEIAQTLNRRAKNTLAIDVIPERLDGADLSAQASFIENVLGQGGVQIVVWLVDSATFGLDPRALPGAFPQEARASAEKIFKSTAASLQRNGTRLLVVTHPSGVDVDPAESAYYKIMNMDYASSHAAGGFEQGYDFNRSMDDLVSESSVPALHLLPLFIEASRGPHEALFSPNDFHFSPAGNAFVAREISRYLLTRKDWISTR